MAGRAYPRNSKFKFKFIYFPCHTKERQIAFNKREILEKIQEVTRSFSFNKRPNFSTKSLPNYGPTT